MNTQNTFSVTEARRNLFNLVANAGRAGARYWITDRGRPQAVIMGADEFSSWQETMEVMLDFPRIKQETKTAEREYKKGNYATLDEILANEASVLKTKPKIKYGISSRIAKKGAKRTR
jgi:prevent-host-death family protein